MAEQGESNLLQRASDIGGAVGLVGMVVAFILWLLSLPFLVVLGVACVSFGALCVGILGHVFLSNNLSFESLGNLRVDSTPRPIVQHESAPRGLAVPPEEWVQAIQKSYDLVKLQPNLVHLKGEHIVVGAGEHDSIVRGVIEGARIFSAVIQPYHNSLDVIPKRRIGGVKDVSAELTYRFFTGKQPLKIHHAVWLSEESTKVDFDVTAKRNLVIATVHNEELYAVEREFDGAHPDGMTVSMKLTGDLFSVRARLISDGVIIDTYEMMLIVSRGETPKLELQSAISWKMSNLIEFRSQGYDLLFKAHEIGFDAHEKGKAIGDFFNAEILAAKNEQLEEVAGHAKKWETEAADFIGTHFSDKAKTGFLNRTPTIDAGLQQARKSPFHFIARPGSEPKREFESRNWELTDSIKTRLDKLEEYEKRLLS